MNSNLNLFIKFHEEASGEFIGRKTMQEHLDVFNEKGKVIWGHFTGSMKKKGLWDEKVSIIKKQQESGEDTFVFFCDRENELLYVGKYLNSYKRNEVERDSPILEYIPLYYHHKVGTPIEEIEGDLRSYAYIEVSDLNQIDFNLVDKIYSNTNKEKVMLCKGMASIFYTNLEEDLHKYLVEKLKSKVTVEIDSNQLNDLDEIIYQKDIEKAYVDMDDNLDIDDTPAYVYESTSALYCKNNKRDPRKALRAIGFAKYMCEYDTNHKFFNSNITGRNYVEAHHFIPLKYQHMFYYSLDIEANIVALCPICHKVLHHGTFEDKKDLIEKVFNDRKDRLERKNIIVSIEEVFNFYK